MSELVAFVRCAVHDDTQCNRRRKNLDQRSDTDLAEPGLRLSASNAAASAISGEDKGLLAIGVP